MSTSLLYHAFGVRDYRYVKTEYVGGEVIFHLERKPESCHCAACGSEHVWHQGSVIRPFRTLPIGRRPVTLGFAEPRRTYTKSFARYALELSRHTTIQDAAEHLGVGWDIVKDIQKQYWQQKFANAQLERFHLSLTSECLSRMIFFGEGSLRNAVGQYLEHYHRERNHQGLNNQIITAGDEVGCTTGEVQRNERLGGLLNYYHRQAA